MARDRALTAEEVAELTSVSAGEIRNAIDGAYDDVHQGTLTGDNFEALTRAGMWSHAKKHIRQAGEVLGRGTGEYDKLQESLAYTDRIE